MTVLGKILVFVNLVFSLVVCALIIMVFIARTNWHAYAEAKDKQLQSAVASADASADQLTAVWNESRAVLAARDAELKKLQGELVNAQQALQTAQEDLKKVSISRDKADASAQKLMAEVQRRAEEVTKLEQFISEANDRNTELVKKMNQERDTRVSTDIENKSLKDRLEIVSRRYEETQKDLVRMKSGATAIAGRQPNPPLENVEGIIKNTDTGGLVTISIGSDSGISRGHTLEVFRLDKVPEKSMYLGTIRIVEVRPHEAVGQPLTRPVAPLRTGDRVASRISFGS
jgi:hypothetical protein